MEKRENAGHRAGEETIFENCQNWCIVKLHIKEVSMKAKRKIVKITYTHYDGWKSKLDMILKAEKNRHITLKEQQKDWQCDDIFQVLKWSKCQKIIHKLRGKIRQTKLGQFVTTTHKQF